MTLEERVERLEKENERLKTVIEAIASVAKDALHGYDPGSRTEYRMDDLLWEMRRERK